MGRKMIWVEEDLAGKLEILNDVVTIKNEDIDKIIKELAEDSDTMADCLDENVLKFKLHAKQIRDNYKKVVDEEISATYTLWETCESLRKESKDKLSESILVTTDILRNVREINEALDKCNIRGVDRMFDLIKIYNELSPEDKGILTKLIQIAKDEI